MKLALTAALLATLVHPLTAAAQVTNDNWETTLRQFDSDYWKAFNSCEVQKMTMMNAEDLEFYHDLGGPMRGRQAFADATSRNICGKPDWRLRRGEVPGTVQYYPLRNNGTVYGAVITGEHYFYHLNKGQPERVEGRARFTHTLLLKDGQWQVGRMLSFDHGPAKQAE
ncbi:nuclear transport factor 2 family protein [Massilia sp. Dwa41.01b]|uniref:nuclear transport factor 2 family protein n=1 Tax=unclassified Massilia TaxID=2609279 RepID=UPI00160251C5|nr:MULTISPECIES: nuclear transport factor 2 family protein [unclassified Massilia]QNA88029.1 nuclear transport factor 2 family protein [Massilia sp. Dwa41.01b]QNA98931.1 nuclear transport factor 2 family protein [Massilia sp. Se16.2.3]